MTEVPAHEDAPTSGSQLVDVSANGCSASGGAPASRSSTNNAPSSRSPGEGPPTDESPDLIPGSSRRPLHDAIADMIAESIPEVVDICPSSERLDAVNIRPELRQLVDLAAKYPELGAPLAQLAFKIGQTGFGNQIVRMGIGKDGPGLEYYFVIANSARRERRYTEARRLTIEAVRAFVRTPDGELASDDGGRLMHLIRLGFSALLFDEKDPNADPEFIADLREVFPLLESRLSSDPFYHTLLAQTRWYDDAEASEASWDHAAETDTTDSTWNARGTWYKDAQHDANKAEYAYRRGLERFPASPLLLHNLGQLLVNKAQNCADDPNKAHRLLNEAEHHLRAALREESQPKGLRRHVHATVDRLQTLRASLPSRQSFRREEPPTEPEREPVVGEVVKGRIRSIAQYGAFVSIQGCGVGLLHKSEIAHQLVDDPTALLRAGQELEVKIIDVGRREGKLRIGLSRKALLPKPDVAPAAVSKPVREPESPPKTQSGTQQFDRRSQRHFGGRSNRDREYGADGNRERHGEPDRERGRDKEQTPRGENAFTSIGEMLLAKLKQQSKP